MNRPGLKHYLTSANLKRIWIGAHGLRSGWAALLFWLIAAAMLACVLFVMHHLHPNDHAPPVMTLRKMLIAECVMLAVGLSATKIMSLIDKRSWLDYGLRSPRRLVFFIQGMGAGVVSLSLLIAALYGVHAIHIERSTATIDSLVQSGALWAGIFVLVGINEEVLFRGYAYFRLFRGTRPLIAGLVSSVVFAAAHSGNAGETIVGVVAVIGAGLLLCLFVWRTQSLWWAIGFHAAWDWSQSFLYGVADSGIGSGSHWLTSQTSGPAWLSGGTVGPEGSLLVLPLMVLVALVAMRFLPARAVSEARS